LNQLQPVNICAIIERETGQAVTAETQLDSVAKDSLEFLQLMLTVGEETGRAIPDSAMLNFQTVGDLEKFLA